MPEKLKNLHYDKSQPAFLQRLRAEFGAGDGKNNVQAARPGKSRLKTGDGEEDEPVIMDERGKGVSREEWERMQKADGEIGVEEVEGREDEGIREAGKEVRKEGEVAGAEQSQRQEPKAVEFGLGKKRKVGKVVGDGAGVEDSEEARTESASVNSKKTTSPKDGVKSEWPTKTRPDVQKKAKKIKLSFDEVGD